MTWRTRPARTRRTERGALGRSKNDGGRPGHGGAPANRPAARRTAAERPPVGPISALSLAAPTACSAGCGRGSDTCFDEVADNLRSKIRVDHDRLPELACNWCRCSSPPAWRRPAGRRLASSSRDRRWCGPSSTHREEHSTMSLNDAVNIEDLHRLAKRRLPKIAFDFIEGGVEDERGLSRNEAAFTSTGSCRAIWSTSRHGTSRRRSSARNSPARSASRRPARPGCSAAAPT